VISRALVEIFRHPALADSLALRGGTALSKLQLRPPARYSEDIDLVHPITRAQVEQNLALKMRDGAFLADLSPLLATGEAWDPIAAEALISERLVTLLPGDPWKGDDH
jgi:Nucleotidyl transferase AbiEii toxin, Type IV TA system